MSYRSSLSIVVAALGLGLVGTHANAADLDPGYAEVPRPLEEKVEFGSGWYIRGDIGVTRTQKVTPSAVTFDTTNPAVIPVPPTLAFDRGNRVGYTASLGAGYQFNRWFRSDVVFDFNQPLRTTYQGAATTCPGSFNAAGQLGQEGCRRIIQAL